METKPSLSKKQGERRGPTAGSASSEGSYVLLSLLGRSPCTGVGGKAEATQCELLLPKMEFILLRGGRQ